MWPKDLNVPTSDLYTALQFRPRQRVTEAPVQPFEPSKHRRTNETIIVHQSHSRFEPRERFGVDNRPHCDAELELEQQFAQSFAVDQDAQRAGECVECPVGHRGEQERVSDAEATSFAARSKIIFTMASSSDSSVGSRLRSWPF